MANTNFDATAARAAGYSDAEIAAYLAQSGRQLPASASAPAPPNAAPAPPTAPAWFDYAGAKAQGYSDAEIQAYLAARSAPKAPVPAADRVQAGEGGVIKGALYTLALPFDTAVNAANLGTAGLGTAYGLTHTTEIPQSLRTPGGLYHYLTPEGVERFSKEPPPAGAKPVTLTHTDIPSALEVNAGPSPVGGLLTQLADKSPITTTQPTRPDDTASRYLNTGASVLPAIAAGGEASIPSLVRSTATAVPPALAAQYVSEAKPFQSDTANNAAAVLTQALGSAAMPRIRGAPVASQANDAVRAGQEAGYAFPPGTTNPTPLNRLVSSLAGKTSINQHASVENQPVTNEQGRAAMGIAPSDGAPISATEIAAAKAAAAPGYDSMRNAGTITAPQDMAARLATALNQQSGAGRLAPSLRNSQLDNLVGEISANKTFDASDAMDTIAELRDRASQAYHTGDASTGRAYRGVSKVIEDAMDRDLSARGQTDVVQGFRDARQRFAAIASVEENRNPTTGNLLAQKLAGALRSGDYLGPDGSPLRVAANAAGQAPKAFAEPTSTPGSNHLGFWGSVLGALELGQHMPLEHGGLELAALPLAYQGARLGARKYALGPGQGGAVQYQPGTIDPRLIAAGVTSAPGISPAP